MQMHKDSHLDHGLTEAQIAHVLARFADREAFTLETIELPPEIGTVPCGLHGPIMGDLPVSDAECVHAKRGERAWTSRLVDRAPRQVRTVTVIAGPHDGEACVVYTMFGGPLAPQEPGDIKAQKDAIEAQRLGPPGMPLSDLSDEHKALTVKRDALREKLGPSRAFWGEHALSK